MADPEVTAQGGPAVEARGLRKTFWAIYGLLGPNGSGKTTLIRLLVGLARATSGEARILGTAMPSRAILDRIGYMTQSEGLYPELSVWENVHFFASLYGRYERGQLLRSLELVELADRVGSPAMELSGGMRRRLSLACALVHEPSVLFLDEPTVGIDPALRVQFWEHFRALARGGATLLVASHVMDEADRCDELLFIRDGRVLARGSGAELRRQAGTGNLEEAFLHFAGVAPGTAGAAR